MAQKNVWEKKLPDLRNKKKEDLIHNSRGSVRLSLGLIYEEKEFEKKRKEVLSKKLP